MLGKLPFKGSGSDCTSWVCHSATPIEVVKEQIEVKVVIADRQMHLPTHEGEPGAEFHQKFLDMIDQPGFEVAFDGVVVKGEKVEQVRVLERLLGQIGLRRRQRAGEIGDGLALTAIEIGFDLHGEHGSTPAMLQRLGRVPEALIRIFHLLEQDDVMAPREMGYGFRWSTFRNLSHRLRDNFRRPIGQVKRPHAEDVTPRKTA